MTIGVINLEVEEAYEEAKTLDQGLLYENFLNAPEEFKESEFIGMFMRGYVMGCQRSGRPTMSLFLSILGARETESPYLEERIAYLKKELKRLNG